MITIGLLGLAALLPLGQWTIFEALKADRGGNCGRAAMRDVVVRRMLDSNNWAGSPRNGAFLIDPLGGVMTGGTNATLGNVAQGVPRISLTYTPTPQTADAIFRATDDLIVSLPEEMNPPQPAGRPVNRDSAGKLIPLDSQHSYSWFASVVPTRNNPTRFTVSIVVCYRRTVNAEQTVPVTNFFDSVPLSGGTVALGGGSLQLKQPLVWGNNIQVRENDWVALCRPAAGNTPPMCRWYRVAAIGDDPSQLTLVGPDWVSPSPGTGASNDKLIALGQEVVGVYTTTVDLDTDPTWKN